MQTITDRSFIDETIDVDGKTFLRCNFERCAFRFRGIDVFTTADCHIGEGCTFEVADHADIVVRQFRAFLTYGGVLGGVVNHFLSEATQGPARLH